MNNTFNPLREPIPDDKIAQIRDLARDLAWGVVHLNWSSTFLSRRWPIEEEELTSKWGKAVPDLWLLWSFGFLYKSRSATAPLTGSRMDDLIDPHHDEFVLTPKAFDLLSLASPSSIFISYRRRESSAFALLLVDRFRSVGLEPFFDIKDILSGEEWHARLEAEIASREHFVCIVGPSSLESENVRKEIRWALDGEKRIHPIYHRGAASQIGGFEDSYPAIAEFFGKNATIIEKEDPKEYEARISELLNQFGYMIQPMYIRSPSS